MPPYVSTPDDLALHGARVLGFAPAAGIAARFGLGAEVVEDLLLDHEAAGFVRHTSFAGSAGWSVTDRGREENERRLCGRARPGRVSRHGDRGARGVPAAEPAVRETHARSGS